MRAPPESLRPMTGAPTRMAWSMILQIFSACASLSEPPKTVKSWLKTKTSRPFTVAAPGDDAIAGHALFGQAEVAAAMLDEHVVFLERVVVEEQLQALSGRELALCVLAFDPRLAAAQPGPGTALLQRMPNVVHRPP